MLTGQAVYAAAQMGIFILISKLFPLEQLGMFALGSAITTPIFILAQFGLRQVLVIDARSQYPFKLYLQLRLLTLGLTVVIGGLVAWLVPSATQVTGIVVLVGLTKTVESIIDIFNGHFQKHERQHMVAHSLMLRGLGMLPAFLVVALLTDSLELGIVTIAVIWLLVLLLHDIPRNRRMQRELGEYERLVDSRLVDGFARRTAAKQLALSALPLAMATMLTSLYFQVPRYLIEVHLNTALVGIYAGMAYPLFALRLLTNSLGESAIPRLATLYIDRKMREFRRVLAQITGVGLVGGILLIIVIMLVGDWLLRILYNPEFLDYSDAFIWVALAGVLNFLISFARYGLTAMRKLKPQPFLIASSILIVIIASTWFIPRYGLVGAAWATLFADMIILPVYLSLLISGMRGLQSKAIG